MSWKGMILAVCDDLYVVLAPRSILEEDPRYRQLIPYVIFREKDKYALFRRIKGNEKRLSNKGTIGVGGHIDIEDCPAKTKGPEEFIRRALWTALSREIFEETNIEINVEEQIEYLGDIESTDTPVDCVHLGKVFVADVKEIDLVAAMSKMEEKEIELIGYKTKEELLEYLNKDASIEIESWSKIVINSMI